MYGYAGARVLGGRHDIDAERREHGSHEPTDREPGTAAGARRAALASATSTADGESFTALLTWL